MYAVSCHLFILAILFYVKAVSSLSQQFTVEVLVILAKDLSDTNQTQFERRWQYCNLFQEVQKNFDSLQKEGIKIKINLSGLKMIMEEEDQWFMKNHNWSTKDLRLVKNEPTFEDFKGFVANQTWARQYDLVMLLTNTFLTPNGVTKISALSNFLGVCHKYRRAFIVEPTVKVITQQFARLLGIPHDSYHKKNNNSCYREGYFMSDDLRTIIYPRFSKCSVRDLKLNLQSDGSKCLRTYNVKDSVQCEKGKDSLCNGFCGTFLPVPYQEKEIAVD